jgi:signal transduction histidine kinase/ligand-binding sensor domain-containing protein
MKKLVFLSFFTVNIAFAQIGQYHFELISSKQGLPTKNVNVVGKDTSRFLWAGTNKGLFRYDGYSFELVAKGAVNALTVDKTKGFVFSISGKGIFWFNTNTLNQQIITAPIWTDSIADNDHYIHPFVDARQRIWASDFHNAKLYQASKKSWKLFPVNPAFSTNNEAIRCFEDAQLRLWIIAQHKIYRFDEPSQSPILVASFLPNSICQTILESSPNQLLIGTNTGHIYTFDGLTNQLKLVKKLEQSVESIAKNKKIKNGFGYLVACKNQLYEFDLQTLSCTAIACLTDTQIEFKHIFYDLKNDFFWISSNQGLIKCKTILPPITNIKIPTTLVGQASTITSVLARGNDQYWLGLSHIGVVDWNKKNNTFRLITNPYHSHINRLLLASNQDLLLATSDGLLRLKDKSNRIEKLSIASQGNIRTIAFDTKNNLWISAENQEIEVRKYPELDRQKLWEDIPTNDFWKENLFHDIVPTAEGKIWLLAWFPKDYGVCYYDEKSRKIQLVSQLRSNINRHKDFMGDYFLKGVYQNKRLFAAGYGGLNIFDNQGKIIDKLDAGVQSIEVDSDNFGNIIIDKNNHIWIGTMDGLYWYKNLKSGVKKLNEKNGLDDNNMSGGMYLTNQNELLVGQSNRILVLNLDALKQQIIPDLWLSKLNVLGGRSLMDFNKPMILNREDNSIELSFSPFNFEVNPTSVYRYRLLNNSATWVSNNQKNNLTLVGLAPDQYELEVAIGDIGGGWNPKTLKLSFIIKPYFSETIWFKLLIISLLALLLYGLYRYRLAHVTAIQSIRTEISADLHDDVGATLSSISILSTIIKTQLTATATSQKYLDIILQDTHALQNKLEEIIWSLRTDRDTVGQFGVRLRMVGTELFEASGIAYNFEISEEISHLRLSMELRRNLLLIAKEAVNNLIKYAHCQKASIILKKQKNNLLLVISDNGKGFDLDRQEGNGLGNMKKRAEKIKGKLTISSALHTGTEVRLEVPITQMSD